MELPCTIYMECEIRDTSVGQIVNIYKINKRCKSLVHSDCNRVMAKAIDHYIGRDIAQNLSTRFGSICTCVIIDKLGTSVDAFEYANGKFTEHTHYEL